VYYTWYEAVSQTVPSAPAPEPRVTKNDSSFMDAAAAE
jgi:hypothetical protein